VELFEVSAEGVCFPHARVAGRLTRAVDNPRGSASYEEWFLLSSHELQPGEASRMLANKRRYWGIESRLHARLDVSALEDQSRVRTPTAALNLAMMRRAALSLAMVWMEQQRDVRQATLKGFFDAMKAPGARQALAVVCAQRPSWLPAG
jgi:hypothetical protein